MRSWNRYRFEPVSCHSTARNAFRLYKEKQQKSGADITQLKPPHINPSEETVEFLLAPTVKAPVELNQMVNV